jgi:DNA-binding IclR family transcriptional regulator
MNVTKSVKISLEFLDCFTSETPAIGVTEISRKLRVSNTDARELERELAEIRG